MVRTVYHPDAVEEHGDLGGGVEAWIATVGNRMRIYEASTHLLGNIDIHVDGSVAASESYCIAFHRRRDDDGVEHEMIMGIRYLDRFEKRGGRWLIAHRQVVLDWSREELAPAPYEGDGVFARGQRSLADPVFALFGKS
jgi:hypothetical protein